MLESVSNCAREHLLSTQPLLKLDLLKNPISFNDKSKIAIVEALSGSINMTTASYGKLLDREAELTASRRNVAQQQFQVPHRSTKFLLDWQLQVNSGVGKETTPARVIATCSIRNALPFAAMIYAMRSLVVLDSRYRYQSI